jgi:uncharacterized protein (DUF1697 family)
MSGLRELFSALGLSDVATVLQTGNVVFAAARRDTNELEATFEQEISERLGLTIDVLARTAREWADVLDSNPFAREAKSDPSHLLVMFLKREVGEAEAAEVQAAARGPEVVHAHARELYITYPAGIGRSRLTGALIEKTLGTRGTGRNWNTLLKINERVRP